MIPEPLPVALLTSFMAWNVIHNNMAMLTALRKPFLPQKVVLYRPVDQNAASEITTIAPFTLSMAAKNGRSTAYVCREFACKLPTTSIDQMLENLRQN